MISVYRNRRLVDQVEAVQSGHITANALAAAARKDIERYEHRLQAWVAFTDEYTQLLKDDEQKTAPLAGVSVAVKDNIDVAGMPTRVGSEVTSEEPVGQDATVVARLRRLGAIIQGKTVTTEFGYFSPGPTVNPWAHNRSPGGSSSGSAAAIGASTVPLALGTQTAGSLTRPASFCGAAGIVLAGESSLLQGVNELAPSLDALGLMTRTVEDLDLVHGALTNRSFTEVADLGQTTLHIWDGSDLLALSSEMQGLLQIIPQVAAEIGIETTPLNWIDHVLTLTEDQHTVMGYEATRTMGSVRAQHAELLSPQLISLLDTGADIEDLAYRQALTRRDNSYRALKRLLGEDGIIIGPAAQGPATPLSAGTGSPELSRPWQLLGLPVVTVPGARTINGLPLGLQLIGIPGSEAEMLALGRLLEPLLRRLPTFAKKMDHTTLKDLTW